MWIIGIDAVDVDTTPRDTGNYMCVRDWAESLNADVGPRLRFRHWRMTDGVQ